MRGMNRLQSRASLAGSHGRRSGRSGARRRGGVTDWLIKPFTEGYGVYTGEKAMRALGMETPL
jgi:hypothetical protein